MKNHEGCKEEAEKCSTSTKHDRFKVSNAQQNMVVGKVFNAQEVCSNSK
jgi:hypothetical protein